VGNGAWALARIDTVMELPQGDEIHDPSARARDELLREVDDVMDLSAE
jgi:hypothetical protein